MTVGPQFAYSTPMSIHMVAGQAPAWAVPRGFYMDILRSPLKS